MLRHLFIKNIALIDNIEVGFDGGLNILTGETGAGKSIIIDSINAVLGSRVSKDMIRTGQDSAAVEAIFDVENDEVEEFLKENELEHEEPQLILSREFSLQGKNICRINGRIVPLSMLKEMGNILVDIHGQHDNQSLLSVSTHIDLLDNFGGSKVLKLKEEYFSLYNKIKEINHKMNELGGDSRERERKIDLLKFQLDDIEAAKLKSGEDEELESKRNFMQNSEKMTSGIESSYDILYSGGRGQSIIDSLNIIIRELGNIQKYDEKIGVYIDSIQQIYYSVEDVTDAIREYKESLDFDPKVLESVEERLDVIFNLKRKYGQSIAEILNYRDNLKRELDELEGSREKLEKLSVELEQLRKDIITKAEELSSERKRIAQDLEKRIVNELEDLEMKRTQFKVSFERIEGESQFSTKGIDNIEFLISPNAGESLKPLSKIASGGEMSRIMLAIKTILGGVDKTPTLIFDEIDIGISGKAAQMVGQKLSSIAESHQVLCITHLPQIASMADNHYLIEKNTEKNITTTKVIKLDFNGRKKEIARILGGVKITDTTLMHAQEMIELAKQKKNA